MPQCSNTLRRHGFLVFALNNVLVPFSGRDLARGPSLPLLLVLLRVLVLLLLVAVVAVPVDNGFVQEFNPEIRRARDKVVQTVVVGQRAA